MPTHNIVINIKYMFTREICIYIPFYQSIIYLSPCFHPLNPSCVCQCVTSRRPKFSAPVTEIFYRCTSLRDECRRSVEWFFSFLSPCLHFFFTFFHFLSFMCSKCYETCLGSPSQTTLLPQFYDKCHSSAKQTVTNAFSDRETQPILHCTWQSHVTLCFHGSINTEQYWVLVREFLI